MKHRARLKASKIKLRKNLPMEGQKRGLILLSSLSLSIKKYLVNFSIIKFIVKIYL